LVGCLRQQAPLACVFCCSPTATCIVHVARSPGTYGPRLRYHHRRGPGTTVFLRRPTVVPHLTCPNFSIGTRPTSVPTLVNHAVPRYIALTYQFLRKVARYLPRLATVSYGRPYVLVLLSTRYLFTRSLRSYDDIRPYDPASVYSPTTLRALLRFTASYGNF